jgi:hypothetical protein
MYCFLFHSHSSDLMQDQWRIQLPLMIRNIRFHSHFH